jgi:hypothetical protein
LSHKFEPKTMLVIPDVHAEPGDSLDRFNRLHAYLAATDQHLDTIVQIGDLWDFASLCLHDKDNPDWNDRSLSDDIDAGLDAFDQIASIADTTGCAYKDIHIIEGNHEERYNRWMKSDNRLRTSPFPMTVRALLKATRPTIPATYTSFLKPRILYGTVFQHYFVSGLMGRPQGGEHHANNLLRSQHTSCVCGHSHLLSTSTRTKGDKSKIHALVSGCFVDPLGEFAYAKSSKDMWWNGVHLLHFYAPGQFDIESISLARLHT